MKPQPYFFLAFGLTLLLLAGSPTPTQAVPISVVNAPVLKWAYGGCFSLWCQTGWYASPAVADLDNDGQPEVIWGSYDVVVLDGADGDEERRMPNGSRVWPGIAVADLTNDGDLEIIVGRSGDQVTVYNHLGGWNGPATPSAAVKFAPWPSKTWKPMDRRKLS